MSLVELNDAKSYLLQQFADESSLYEHLVKSMKTILFERPSNPKKAFAILCQDSIIAKSANVVDNVLESESNEKIIGLLNFKPKEERNVQDIGKLGYLLECSGIDVDKNEFRLLAASIEKLSEDKQLESCRFWGKFDLGKNGQYYIVEAEIEDNKNTHDVAVFAKLNEGINEQVKNPQIQIPAPVEEHDGPNKYVYFVSKVLYDEWNMLPEVIPYHIVASRSQKFQLSGNLQNLIRGFPPFFGNELQLLRTLIARINAGTTIAPVNFYIFDEDSTEEEKSGIILNPEYQPDSAHEMSKLENWAHISNYILPQGRCTWVATKAPHSEQDLEEEEQEDTNVANSEDEKAEIGPSLLSSIDQDELHFDLQAWSARAYGIQPKTKTVILRSHKWPGALAVFQQGTFYNVYLGNGQKDFVVNTDIPIANETELEFRTEETDPDPELEKIALAQEQPEEISEE